MPNSEIKASVSKELNTLSLGLKNSKFILTTRTGEFNINLENSRKFEISPLNNDQIKSFTKKWIRNKKEAEEFYKQILRTPYADTAIRPLTIAHLCTLYNRYKEIPKKPKTVYRKVVKLLLQEWDAQRQIHRKSKYGNFDIERKMDFLTNFSFLLTTEFQSITFDTWALRVCYQKLHSEFDLPISEQEMNKVFEEIEGYSGLIVRSGYDKFQFAHRSIQEYLTAEYLVRLIDIPDEPNILEKLPNELAIAISLSSNSSKYFAKLVLVVLNKNIKDHSFINSFITRIKIENPDFRVESILAVAIAYIGSMFISEAEEDEYSYQLIESLLSIDNVRKSFERLENLYNPKTEITNIDFEKNESIILNKKHDVGISNKYNAPDTLILRDKMAKIFYQNHDLR